MILKRILVLLVLHQFLIAKNAIIKKHAPNAKIIFIYQYQKKSCVNDCSKDDGYFL